MKHTLVSPRRVRELSYHPLARAVSFALGVMLASTAAPAFAGPESGQIVEGIGTITQGVDTTLITQGGQTLNIDWQSFNVDATETSASMADERCRRDQSDPRPEPEPNLRRHRCQRPRLSY